MTLRPVKLAGKPYEIHLLAVIVLYVLGFVVYLNSFPVPFVFDDYPNILDNPSIRLAAIDLEELHATGFKSPLGRRPISNISFALNYLAGGYDVKGYHLVNILIHIVNGVLVYFLALILLRKDRTLTHRMPASERRLRLAALFAAAIFIAHPVQVQAVTYIVQRMTSMATMFYLSLMLFPYPARLSLEHTFSISHSLVDPMTTLVAAAILVVLLFTALRLDPSVLQDQAMPSACQSGSKTD